MILQLQFQTWKKFIPGIEDASDKKESSSSIVIDGWTITNPVKNEGVKDYKFDKSKISGDSMKGSDHLKGQSTEDGEVNDANDTFKGSDYSNDQTKETHPPRPKKVIVDPFVIPKKVNDSEFESFKKTLFALFKSNGQQNPKEDVKIAIFEKN